MTDGRLIGSADAAQLLGVHKATVIRWADDGKLTLVEKLPGDNGPYLFNRADVEALAAELADRRSA